MGGAHDELTQALKDLHDSAGRPSVRVVSKAVAADDQLAEMVSHDTVSQMLRGTGAVPRWAKLECVAVVLSVMAAVPGAADTVGARKVVRERFLTLWQAADDARGQMTGNGQASGGEHRTDTAQSSLGRPTPAGDPWRIGESLTGGLSRLRSVSVAADGSALAVVAAGMLKITNPRNSKPLGKAVKAKSLRHAALSADGGLLAGFAYTRDDENCELSVTETRGIGDRRSYMECDEEVRDGLLGLTFTADNRLLYLVSDRERVWRRTAQLSSALRLKDPLTMEYVGTPFPDAVGPGTRSAAISHDGTVAATATDHHVTLWSAETGNLVHTTELSAVACIAFASSGSLLCINSSGILRQIIAPTRT